MVDRPSKVCLADLGLRERERFTCAYDFFSPLQCWSHDLRVEAISPSRPRRRYPWCSGGARSAPPEDCDGAEAFLALRQEHSLVDTTLRMAELTGLLLEAPPSNTVREVLGEAPREVTRPAVLERDRPFRPGRAQPHPDHET